MEALIVLVEGEIDSPEVLSLVSIRILNGDI